ncbi:MAG: FAD-binding protein, partial [Pseudomonadota bacterium]|nr:FAD-binding protein [Pseudomonadota bacterium]
MTGTDTTVGQAVTKLRERLGDRLSTGASIRELHARDEAYSAPVLPDAVAFPDNAEEVADIARICAGTGCPIVPYGIGTSLEGHVVPVQGGVSVDFSRMNRILKIDERNLLATVEPGVTRTQLNEALRATGLMFTVDPGADATIGGMTATRASGTNAVRYGTMRENVMALEVVLPDGQVIRTGTKARKSSAGYDLTHLFVGSEGTLGLITRITVRLFGQPEAIMAATCAFESVDGAVDAVMDAMQVGLPMARIEFLDEVQMQ